MPENASCKWGRQPAQKKVVKDVQANRIRRAC